MTATVTPMRPRCCVVGGWVMVELSTIPTVRPCQTHRTEQYARWRKGAFRPTPFEWFLELEEVDG